MGIRFNCDTDADYIMLQHQGVLIPTPTRIAVDDGENIQGGVQPGGGSTSAAGGSAVAGTAAQQNFSQIQENPLPCVAHDTLLDRAAEGDSWVGILVQDLMPGMNLRYGGRRNYVEQIDRVWCDGLWFIEAQGHRLVCSPEHRVITNVNDGAGTPVNTLKIGDTWLLRDGPALITTIGHTNRPGWVYRIALRGDGAPESHWFIGNGGVSHNVKIQDDQR